MNDKTDLFARLDGAHLLVSGSGRFMSAAVREHLESHGVLVLGPVHRTLSALLILEFFDIDATIFDVYSVPSEVAPIIMALTKRNIPFIFAASAETNPKAKYILRNDDAALAEIARGLFGKRAGD